MTMNFDTAALLVLIDSGGEEERERDLVVKDYIQRGSIRFWSKHILNKINIKEFHKLLNLLYHIGIIHDYLAALDATDDDGCEIRLFLYFNFDTMKINPQNGRITHLSLQRKQRIIENELMDISYIPFNVPSIIEQFQCLESLELWNCNSVLPLCNLPLLKTITFSRCSQNIFQNIPEGLETIRFTSRCSQNIFQNIPEGFKLPSSIKKISFQLYSLEFNTSLSPFMKTLPNTLEELHLWYVPIKDQTDEVLRVLQNDDLSFTQSLTTITMEHCSLNDDDLKRLMFDIRERFPNLRTINVKGNKIKSLCGIDHIIKATPTTISSPSSSSSQSLIRNRINLRNLLLDENPVLTKIEPKDKATLLTILHTFNGISNLGKPIYSTYDPDVEHVLRINHAGRKYITMEGGGGGGREIGDGDGEISLDGTTKSNINQALWPLILERAYKKSHEIYSEIYVPRMYNTQKYRDTKKCATGLFDIVHHYWPIFMDRRYCGRWDESINNDNDNDNR